MINELFILGNALLLIASFPLISTVWKNKNILKDYNPAGSILTLAALMVFWMAYALMYNWMSILINIPTVILWGLASWYSACSRVKKNKTDAFKGDPE